MGVHATGSPRTGRLPAGAALLACLAGWLLSAAPTAPASPKTPSFEQNVQPALIQVCRNCHNAEMKSGNLDIANYLQPSSLNSDRDGWTKILVRLKAGAMPPPGTPRPSPPAMASLIGYVESALNTPLKPDPGRVIAHRLNRSEYTNTVRDILGVDFEATEEFPADDSGYGFDNIANVLTVSPALMREYLSAAEKSRPWRWVAIRCHQPVSSTARIICADLALA